MLIFFIFPLLQFGLYFSTNPVNKSSNDNIRVINTILSESLNNNYLLIRNKDFYNQQDIWNKNRSLKEIARQPTEKDNTNIKIDIEYSKHTDLDSVNIEKDNISYTSNYDIKIIELLSSTLIYHIERKQKCRILIGFLGLTKDDTIRHHFTNIPKFNKTTKKDLYDRINNIFKDNIVVFINILFEIGLIVVEFSEHATYYDLFDYLNQLWYKEFRIWLIEPDGLAYITDLDNNTFEHITDDKDNNDCGIYKNKSLPFKTDFCWQNDKNSIDN